MVELFCFRIFSAIAILIATCYLFLNNHTILQGDFYILIVGSCCAAFIFLFLLHEIFRIVAPNTYARYQQWLIDNDGFLTTQGMLNYYLSRILTLNFFMEILSFISLTFFFLCFFTFLNEYHNTNSELNMVAQVTDQYVMHRHQLGHVVYENYTKVHTPKGNIKIVTTKYAFSQMSIDDYVTVKLYKGNLGLYYATELRVEKNGMRILV